MLWPAFAAEANYTDMFSVQLNQMPAGEKLVVYRDKNNSGKNSVISFGQYTGGRLWVEGYGNEPPPSHV